MTAGLDGLFQVCMRGVSNILDGRSLYVGWLNRYAVFIMRVSSS